MPKAVGLVFGYLPWPASLSSKTLTPLLNQSAVEIQNEMSRACMVFPRLPLVDSSAPRALQFFCCETRGVDFKQVYTSTPVRINAENEGVCCCLSVNDMWNVATMTQIACDRFVKNETYPRSDHSFKRRFKIVYSTLY